jgi:hypothetical protein
VKPHEHCQPVRFKSPAGHDAYGLELAKQRLGDRLCEQVELGKVGGRWGEDRSSTPIAANASMSRRSASGVRGMLRASCAPQPEDP